MSGPPVLEERPAYRRTLSRIHFTFLATSSKALFQSRHSFLARRSSNEVLLLREYTDSNLHHL